MTSVSMYEWIESQPGGTLASEPVEYPQYQEIVVTRAVYEQLIADNARLRELLQSVGGYVDILRYSHSLDDAIHTAYQILGDKQLAPYLWPDETREATHD